MSYYSTVTVQFCEECGIARQTRYEGKNFLCEYCRANSIKRCTFCKRKTLSRALGNVVFCDKCSATKKNIDSNDPPFIEEIENAEEYLLEHFNVLQHLIKRLTGSQPYGCWHSGVFFCHACKKIHDEYMNISSCKKCYAISCKKMKPCDCNEKSKNLPIICFNDLILVDNYVAKHYNNCVTLILENEKFKDDGDLAMPERDWVYCHKHKKIHSVISAHQDDEDLEIDYDAQTNTFNCT